VVAAVAAVAQPRLCPPLPRRLPGAGRGTVRLASHLLASAEYSQVLNDGVGNERALGIAAGLAWGEVAEATVVYADRGISGGMRQGIVAAKAAGRVIEYRNLTPARKK